MLIKTHKKETNQISYLYISTLGMIHRNDFFFNKKKSKKQLCCKLFFVYLKYCLFCLEYFKPITFQIPFLRKLPVISLWSFKTTFYWFVKLWNLFKNILYFYVLLHSNKTSFTETLKLVESWRVLSKTIIMHQPTSST